MVFGTIPEGHVVSGGRCSSAGTAIRSPTCFGLKYIGYLPLSRERCERPLLDRANANFRSVPVIRIDAVTRKAVLESRPVGMLAPSAELRAWVVPATAERSSEPAEDHEHGKWASMGWARLLERVIARSGPTRDCAKRCACRERAALGR